MKLEAGIEAGVAIVKQLEKYCERIELGGSVRRLRPVVKDVEVVCIRKDVQTGLFHGDMGPSPQFVAQVEQWEKVKGDPRGKYTQRLVKQPAGEQVTLDLFMCVPENWGLILAIRTGSAEWVHQHLARRWCDLGYTSRDGMLHDRQGRAVPVREEAELFELLGMPWVDPEEREV